MRSASRSRTYVVRVSFEAPLDFVYRWCTDYSPADPGLEGEAYQRKVLSASPKEVLYEDLMESPAGGWLWSRWRVTLKPPGGWHGEAIGSSRDWSVDYRLRARSPTRTELTLRGRRRPARLAGKGPTPAQVQAGLEGEWRSFKKALEADFRRSRTVAGARGRRKR
jgi:hypothetical protein